MAIELNSSIELIEAVCINMIPERQSFRIEFRSRGKFVYIASANMLKSLSSGVQSMQSTPARNLREFGAVRSEELEVNQ